MRLQFIFVLLAILVYGSFDRLRIGVEEPTSVSRCLCILTSYSILQSFAFTLLNAHFVVCVMLLRHETTHGIEVEANELALNDTHPMLTLVVWHGIFSVVCGKVFCIVSQKWCITRQAFEYLGIQRNINKVVIHWYFILLDFLNDFEGRHTRHLLLIAIKVRKREITCSCACNVLDATERIGLVGRSRVGNVDILPTLFERCALLV